MANKNEIYPLWKKFESASCFETNTKRFQSLVSYFVKLVLYEQDVESINFFIEREFLNPFEWIGFCLGIERYSSFIFLLSFLTLKEINSYKNYRNKNVFEILISNGQPDCVLILIEKGVDFLNLNLNFDAYYEPEKKCLEIVQKKQKEIIFNLLCKYLIDDLCNLVYFFYFF